MHFANYCQKQYHCYNFINSQLTSTLKALFAIVESYSEFIKKENYC